MDNIWRETTSNIKRGKFLWQNTCTLNSFSKDFLNLCESPQFSEKSPASLSWISDLSAVQNLQIYLPEKLSTTPAILCALRLSATTHCNVPFKVFPSFSKKNPMLFQCYEISNQGTQHFFVTIDFDIIAIDQCSQMNRGQRGVTTRWQIA